MPIYAFECDACSHSFERLQRLSDADPTDCPECGVAQVRRQLTAPQFRLSGGGWYETDFKKDGDKKRNLAGDSGGGSAGADAKPVESKATESKTETSKPAEAKPAAPAKVESKPAA
ncbi:MAG: FmdB family zinc ribbon protein [Lysobacter sp.]